jgi:hypothetical protein
MKKICCILLLSVIIVHLSSCKKEEIEMGRAKRTFYKLLGPNGIIGVGVIIGGNTEQIVLSAINKCRITSISCQGSAQDDNTQLAVPFFVNGSVDFPSSVGAADKEQLPRGSGTLFFDDKKFSECYIDIPAGASFGYGVSINLYTVPVNAVNFSTFIIVNYEEEIFE